MSEKIQTEFAEFVVRKAKGIEFTKDEYPAKCELKGVCRPMSFHENNDGSVSCSGLLTSSEDEDIIFNCNYNSVGEWTGFRCTVPEALEIAYHLIGACENAFKLGAPDYKQVMENWTERDLNAPKGGNQRLFLKRSQ